MYCFLSCAIEGDKAASFASSDGLTSAKSAASWVTCGNKAVLSAPNFSAADPNEAAMDKASAGSTPVTASGAALTRTGPAFNFLSSFVILSRTCWITTISAPLPSSTTALTAPFRSSPATSALYSRDEIPRRRRIGSMVAITSSEPKIVSPFLLVLDRNTSVSGERRIPYTARRNSRSSSEAKRDSSRLRTLNASRDCLISMSTAKRAKVTFAPRRGFCSISLSKF